METKNGSNLKLNISSNSGEQLEKEIAAAHSKAKNTKDPIQEELLTVILAHTKETEKKIKLLPMHIHIDIVDIAVRPGDLGTKQTLNLATKKTVSVGIKSDIRK